LKSSSLELEHNKLAKLNVQELKDLLTRMSVCISNRNNNSIVPNVVSGALNVVENISTKTPIKNHFDLTGFADLLNDDPSFQDLVEELQLEYLSIASFSPEKRLVFAITTAALKASAINKVKKMIEQKNNP